MIILNTNISGVNGAQNLGVIEFESLFVPANKKYPYGTISSQMELGYQSWDGYDWGDF